MGSSGLARKNANGSNQAIELARKLSKHFDPIKGPRLMQSLIDDPEYLGKWCWLPLLDLVLRPYWSRVWVMQEIAMAGSGLILRCGTCTIDWETFITGIGTIHLYLWTVKNLAFSHEWKLQGNQGEPYLRTSTLHIMWKELRVLNEREEEETNQLGIESLLNVSSEAIASDRRDHVYGLIGLMEPSLAIRIAPDYSLDIPRVFVSVARTAIFASGNLEIFRHCNPWGTAGAPSWAPDWTWDNRPRDGTLQYQFNASGTRTSEFSFSEDDLVLNCKGLIIDSVAGLTSRTNDEIESYRSVPKTLLYVPKTLIQPKVVNSPYGGVDSARTALRCAFAAASEDPKSEKYEALWYIPPTFDIGLPQFQNLHWGKFALDSDFYFKWEDWLKVNGEFLVGNQPLRDYFSKRLPENASYMDCWDSYRQFVRIIQDRRLAMISKGYIGWVPHNMFRGDEVQPMLEDLFCIIFGCSTPIVLRPCGKYYQVIGEGYLQGFMEGEALKLLDLKTCSVTNFIIR
jgi:hypothetical protein